MKTKKLVVAILTLLLSLVLVACKKEMTPEERLAAVFEPSNFEKLVSNHSVIAIYTLEGEDDEFAELMYQDNLMLGISRGYQMYFEEITGVGVWSYYKQSDLWYKELDGDNLEFFNYYGHLLSVLEKDFFVYDSARDLYIMDEAGLKAYANKVGLAAEDVISYSIVIENNQITRIDYSAYYTEDEDRDLADVTAIFYDYGRTAFTLPEAQIV